MKCTIENCPNTALRIIKSMNMGYCLEHWKDLAGNLNHFHVQKLYPCPNCRWTFSRNSTLLKHKMEYHKWW
jgi:hypothetical protein